MRRALGVLSLLSGVLLVCLYLRGSAAAPPPLRKGEPASTQLPGVKLTSHDASIGAAIASGNLTVFPIYAAANPQFADAIALDRALARKQARVRELDADDPALEGAEVGTLVIDNLGSAPIVVLAGTVVKGGKQDRQIGQDFVIAAKSTVDVEAFCVEQGRWSGEREGKNTGGSFSGSGMIAPSAVRIAAQYESDQGKVWSEVAEANEKSAKSGPQGREAKSSQSGTLMATYDDGAVVAKRKAIATKLVTSLESAVASERIMGLAYAVDGSIRGVRWFGSRGLFEQHRKQLLETMAVESILAVASKGAVKRPSPKDVRDFVEGVATTEIKASKKRAKTMNTNVYKESAKAYSSEARLDADGDDPAPKPVTVDISAK